MFGYKSDNSVASSLCSYNIVIKNQSGRSFRELLFLLLFSRPIFLIPIETALSFWMRGNQASDSNWSSQQPCVSEGRSKSGFISVHYCRANQGPVITHLSGGLLHH